MAVENITGEEYSVEYDPERHVVAFIGTVRLQATADYEPIMALLDKAQEGTTVLTVDFRNLQFLNSSGISAISRFVISARKRDAVAVTVLGNQEIYWQRKSLTNLQKLWPKVNVEIS